MQQQDERTRLVHWILLLLFASFAGFNYADFGIRWIQLVVDTFVRPGTYEVISEVISRLTQSLHNLSITYL